MHTNSTDTGLVDSSICIIINISILVLIYDINNALRIIINEKKESRSKAGGVWYKEVNRVLYDNIVKWSYI